MHFQIHCPISTDTYQNKVLVAAILWPLSCATSQKNVSLLILYFYA